MGVRRRRGLSATVLVVTVAATLAGCSDDGREGAEAALGELVGGLRAGDLADVPLAGAEPAAATEELGAVVAGMGELEPTVEGADLVVDGDTATADLAWSWGDDAWAYRTDVGLVRDGDAWAVTWTPALVEPSLVEGETLRAVPLAAERGDVLAGDGTPLVTSRDVVRYGIDKSRVDAATAQASAQQLAEALDLDAAAYVARVAAAGDRAFVEALVVRAEQADLELLSGTPGVAAVPDRRSLAPSRAFAAPILGTVGEATAEVVEDSDGRVQPGDVVGLSGLQRRYDEQLTGTPGLLVQAQAPEGSVQPDRELHRTEPVAGSPLATTLDTDLQLLAETQLSSVGPPSALVALRPSDGAVLVAASGPGSGGQNTATFGQYAPGSTFKVVSSLALLRAGLTPDSTVSCPPTVTVDGRAFENYDDYPAGALGDITLRQAVAGSCNTAFIGSAGLLGEGDLAGAAAALGLGVDHDLGFPAYFGDVPSPESETEAAASLIGQGRVLASPMAMAAVAASVQAGEAVVPTLLPEVDVDRTPPAAPLTADEAAALQGLMRAVVTDGSGSVLAGLGGEPVGAKTGTAEYGTDVPPATHAWMIATRGDLAVAVFVETGASGSSTAGPILRAFLEGAGG